MKIQRRGVSTIAAASVVAVIVVILIATAVVSSKPAKTITHHLDSTTTPPSVSTSISTTVSTVTSTGAPLISYSADAYTAEVTSLLNGFATSTGAQVAPLKSGGSFADANADSRWSPRRRLRVRRPQRDLLAVPEESHLELGGRIRLGPDGLGVFEQLRKSPQLQTSSTWPTRRQSQTPLRTGMPSMQP